MKRKSCPENRCSNDFFVISRNAGDTKRCDDLLFAALKDLAYLISKDVSDSFEVFAESHAVLLDVYVADLRNELIQKRVLFSKVDDFHINSRLYYPNIICKAYKYIHFPCQLQIFSNLTFGQLLIRKTVITILRDYNMVHQRYVASVKSPFQCLSLIYVCCSRKCIAGRMIVDKNQT